MWEYLSYEANKLVSGAVLLSTFREDSVLGGRSAWDSAEIGESLAELVDD